MPKRPRSNTDPPSTRTGVDLDTPRQYLTAAYLQGVADNHRFREFKRLVLLNMEASCSRKGRTAWDFSARWLRANRLDGQYVAEQLALRGFRVVATKYGLTVTLTDTRLARTPAPLPDEPFPDVPYTPASPAAQTPAAPTTAASPVARATRPRPAAPAPARGCA